MNELAELLERFRLGPDKFESAVAGLEDGEADYRPAPGKWTIRQIASHLADSELEAGVRFRRMIAEDKPGISSYDQDKWANNLDYHSRLITRAVAEFQLLRGGNYQLLKSLPPEAFDRTAIHSERGEMPMRRWLEIYAGHAEKHSAQIDRIRQQFRSQVKTSA